MTQLNFKTLPMDSVEIKQNHQQVKKVLIVKQILTRSTMANVQCIEYAYEHLGLKGLTIACENIRFSSLFPAGDISNGCFRRLG